MERDQVTVVGVAGTMIAGPGEDVQIVAVEQFFVQPCISYGIMRQLVL
jgi:hypothetical protein